MNKIYIVLFLFIVSISFTNCKTEEDAEPIPLRDYQQQFNNDKAALEEFLQTHSFTVVNNPGAANDQDVIFAAIPADDSTTESIWESDNLLTRPVTLHGVEYNIYYLSLREGGGADISNPKLQPTDVDAVLAAYTGTYLFYHTKDTIYPNPTNPGVNITEPRTFLKSHQFESNTFPQNNLNLEGVIKGWREIFPQFRPGDFTQSPGNPTVYTDFGAGIMFIPSGLGYYNGAAGGVIPAYSPLIFTFKLYEVHRLDQDQDGVPSWLEDRNGDRYLTVAATGSLDDTDGDLAPDYLDLDDDGDFFLTKNEVHLNEDGTVIFEDCDGDTVPNYLDPDVCDCDGDGIADPQDEDICDCDLDGIPDYLDPDNCP